MQNCKFSDAYNIIIIIKVITIVIIIINNDIIIIIIGQYNTCAYARDVCICVQSVYACSVYMRAASAYLIRKCLVGYNMGGIFCRFLFYSCSIS